MSDVSEDIRWEAARLKLDILGTVPSTFSSIIRSLRSDLQKSPPVLSHISTSEIKRILRSPSTLAPFLAALKEYKPEAISTYKDPTKAIIQAFEIDEVCGLLNCIYLLRQVKKRIDPDEWKFIIEILCPAVTISGHLGLTISAIGFERAIFTVCSNILGMALFHTSASKQYLNYRRILKKTNKYCDTIEELTAFNCSNRELCSLLAQSIALSPALATEYLEGISPAEGQRPSTATQALSIWMKSLYAKGTAPQEAMDSKWYPNKSDVEEIESLTRRTQNNNQPENCWLLAESNSIEELVADFAKIGGHNTDESRVELDNNEDL